MKKIIGAALAGSMLAGTAFAADLSFSYTGSNYFSAKKGNLDYLGSNRTDCLSVELSNELAGVVVDFDTEEGKLKQDQYYAWMTFGLPVGNLQITAGSWVGRYSNKVTADAGDLDGEDWIQWKMGIVGPLESIGKDSDNLTEGNMSTIFAYTLDDMLPGALLVKAGLVKTIEWDTWKTREESKWSWNSGFVGELCYRQEGLINVDLALKNYQKTDLSAGLFVSPLMIDELQATLGLTLATERPDTTTTHDKNELYDRFYDFAVDLRARYAITENLAVTTAHNITYYNVYDAKATAEDNKYDDNFVAMSNQIGFAFKAAENLTFKASYQQYMSQVFEFHPGNSKECFVDEIFFSPSVEIAATEKATVTVATRFGWQDVGHEGHETFGIQVPVIFSYNY